MAKSPHRPRHRNKADRLFSLGATTDEIRCDMMLAPFDQICSAMETKWGIGRLPELVSVETADRWGSAMAKLNAAIAAADIAETKKRVAVCVRGLQAMDAEAEAAGHKPRNPEIWECEYNGRVFAVIQDGREWMKAEAIPGRRVFSMQEVAVALDAMDRGLLMQIKDAIPEAKVVAARPAENPIPPGGDPIPF